MKTTMCLVYYKRTSDDVIHLDDVLHLLTTEAEAEKAVEWYREKYPTEDALRYDYAVMKVEEEFKPCEQYLYARLGS